MLSATIGKGSGSAGDRQTEKALRESEERYQRLVELSPNGILVYQLGKIVDMNAAGARLFGASSSIELIGKLLIDFVRLECRLAVEDQMQGVGEGPARRDVWGKKS
ncbi:MAG TPA: PAS domain-containing protein [Bryobacteraceae bacterium]|nr:PAS domain-containing protein [Bryobacteraceae bacterium]